MSEKARKEGKHFSAVEFDESWTREKIHSQLVDLLSNSLALSFAGFFSPH